MIVDLTMRPAARRHIGRCLFAALVALSVIGTAQRAVAQAVPPQAPANQPSPAAILLAKQILELKHARDIFQPLVRGVIVRTKNTFMQTNFMWQKDFDEVAANLEKQYDPRVSELVDASARIYASHFTEAELKQLLTFYQTPLGQKAIVEEPKALDESMNNAGKWADNLSLEVIDSMRAEMKKRGHDI
jgi:hypothetical protein